MARYRLLICWGLLTLLLHLVACQQERKPASDLFQEAEQAYRGGDYDEALRKYEEFLEQDPNSPLSSLAKQRISNIEREFNNVMGNKKGLHPIYLKPNKGGQTGPNENPQ